MYIKGWIIIILSNNIYVIWGENNIKNKADLTNVISVFLQNIYK